MVKCEFNDFCGFKLDGFVSAAWESFPVTGVMFNGDKIKTQISSQSDQCLFSFANQLRGKKKFHLSFLFRNRLLLAAVYVLKALQEGQ